MQPDLGHLPPQKGRVEAHVQERQASAQPSGFQRVLFWHR
jgi:hypothetical protein